MAIDHTALPRPNDMAVAGMSSRNTALHSPIRMKMGRRRHHRTLPTSADTATLIVAR